MGNIFIKKKKNIKNEDLYKSLLYSNLGERIVYIENKLDNLDEDFYVFRGKTDANLQVMSKDIHAMFMKLPT
tara:strand:- start:252 stop:467 length:216 start_codon:yes stop_codon:yes gene_type:complete